MTSTPWLSLDEQRNWRAFLTGSALLMERLDADLRALGLSMPEYEILVRLSEAPERTLRMNELASLSHQSRSRLTHTITRMERTDLVKRETCVSDGRGVLAKLTDHGYQRLVEAAPTHAKGVREAFVDVLDPDDYATLGRAFTAVAEAATGPKPTGARRKNPNYPDHDTGCPGR